MQPEMPADLHQGVAVHGVGGVRRSGVPQCVEGASWRQSGVDALLCQDLTPARRTGETNMEETWMLTRGELLY